MQYHQTQPELNQHLREQIQFLVSSSEGYDKGYSHEAKRLAVVIRILLHDTSHSFSLLKQLKLKNLRFLESGHNFDPKNLLSHSGLTAMRATKSGAEYVPLLGDGPPLRKISFQKWWEKRIIIWDKRKKFSRRDIILALSNKDGGAHVDPSLDSFYADLTRKNSLGWSFLKGDLVEDIIGAELATVRQIAYELLKTLMQNLPDLFENAEGNLSG